MYLHVHVPVNIENKGAISICQRLKTIDEGAGLYMYM